MNVECPHCRGVIAYVPTLAGKMATCPRCQGNFVMPKFDHLSLPATDSPPQIVPRSVNRASGGANHISAYEAYHRGFWGGLGIWTAMMVLSALIGLLTLAGLAVIGGILTAAGR
jgi:hypothetical protein